MTDIALKIDIQTILKMVKFNEHFRRLFKRLTFFGGKYNKIIDDYVTDTSIINKNLLWSDLSTIDNIPEVNFIIGLWRRDEPNYQKIENDIKEMVESDLGHSVIGKIIQFDDIMGNHKKLILEGKKQNFQYNGFKIIPTSDKFLQLFF